jgi:hypothetical protein
MAGGKKGKESNKDSERMDRRTGSARRIDDQYFFTAPAFFSLPSTLRKGPYWVSV